MPATDCLSLSGLLTCGVGAVTKATGNAIFSALTSWWQSSFQDLMNGFSSTFAQMGSVDLSRFQSTPLWRTELTLAGFIMVVGVIVAGARGAWGHHGGPVATAMVGLVKATLATGAIFAVMGALLAVSDAVTAAIITGAMGSAANFSHQLNTLAGGTVTGAAWEFLVALFGVVAIVVLWVEMLARTAGLIIVTMTAPIGAAGLVQESTSGWWTKLVAAELALVFVKPVIALVLAVGITASAGASGISGSIVGIMILAAAALAWPVVARLFTFHTPSFGAGWGSAVLGAGIGRLARGGGGSGSFAQGQPAEQTMGALGARASTSGESALGGGGYGASAAAGGVGAGAAVGAAALSAASKASQVPGQVVGRAGEMASGGEAAAPSGGSGAAASVASAPAPRSTGSSAPAAPRAGELVDSPPPIEPPAPVQREARPHEMTTDDQGGDQ